MKALRRYMSGSNFFQICVTVILILFFCVELYPILYVISSSFSDPDAVMAGELVLWPIGFTLEGYEFVFQYKEIWMGYANTVLYTVAGTLLNLAVTLPCTYALSRDDLVGRGGLMVVFMVTMYVGGGLIPGYLNMKSFGLVNTRLIMIIDGALSVYNMIVARTFFANTIPGELTDAAKIDGCSDFGIFSRIVMPLSKAIVAVMGLYYGVGHWNSYFNAMIYLDDRKKYPLQMFLREILLDSKVMNQVNDNVEMTQEQIRIMQEAAKSANLVKYCVIIVATLPMMLIYPKLQKFFEKGVMIGSIKG